MIRLGILGNFDAVLGWDINNSVSTIFAAAIYLAKTIETVDIGPTDWFNTKQITNTFIINWNKLSFISYLRLSSRIAE